MADPQADKLRLQLEATRIEIERFKADIERYKSLLDAWRTNVGPLEQRADALGRHAVAYGQLAIRNVFLLNGGAIIAVPSFAQLVKTPLNDSITLFLVSMGSFVLGLCLITASALFAYLNFIAAQQIAQLDAGHMRTVLNRDKRKLAEVAPPDDYKSNREALIDRQNWTARGSIGLGLAGGAVFVVGMVFAMLVLAGVRG